MNLVDWASGQHPANAEQTEPVGIAGHANRDDAMAREIARLREQEKYLTARAEDAERQLHEALARRGHDGRGEQRQTHDVLADMANTMEAVLAEMRRANSADRTGAVSSAQIKTSTRGYDIDAKAYAGSEVPVDEALEAYGRLVREAKARELDGWAATVDSLAEGRPA